MTLSDQANSGDLPEEQVDGRRLRGERNRLGIVDAFLELVSEGSIRPTVEEVAARAEVSERSVFRHFPDVAALVEAAMNRWIELVTPAAAVHASPEDPLAVRIAALVESRSRLYEHIAPLRRVTMVERASNPSIDSMMQEGGKFLRDQAEELLAPEGLDPTAKSGLDALLSWSLWTVLRIDQGLSLEESRVVLGLLIDKLLA